MYNNYNEQIRFSTVDYRFFVEISQDGSGHVFGQNHDDWTEIIGEGLNAQELEIIARGLADAVEAAKEAEKNEIIYPQNTGEEMIMASGWSSESHDYLQDLGDQVDEILKPLGVFGPDYAGDAMHESEDWAIDLINDYAADPATVTLQLIGGQTAETRALIAS